MKLKNYFEGLLNYKTAHGMDHKTIEEYKRLWKYVLIPSGVPEIEIDKLKVNDISNILIAGKDRGVTSGQRGVVVLRQLLKFIRGEGLTTSVNWWEISLPTLPRKNVEYLTDEEMNEVRSAFDMSSFTGIRDRAIVEILRSTGLRIGEACALNRDQIDWNKKECEVENNKTHEVDKVYFNDECLRWLKIYLDVRNDNFPPLFVSITGRRVMPSGVRRTISDAMKRAGVKKRIYPHIFRKTFCTELLFNGVDIKSVQTLARQKSERTTLRYYTAVNKARCKDLHEQVMNKSNHIDNLEVKENGEGQKFLVSTTKHLTSPVIIKHARLLNDLDIVDDR